MCDVRDNIVEEIPHLRRYALSLVGPSREFDADDLIQASVEKALKSADRFEPGTNLRGWLFAIVRNTFLSGKRRDSVKTRYVHEQTQTENDAVAASQDMHLMLVQTNEALDTLPKKERETLFELAVLEHPQERVARRFREPVGTLKSRLSRTRAKLRDHMDGMRTGGLSGLAV